MSDTNFSDLLTRLQKAVISQINDDKKVQKKETKKNETLFDIKLDKTDNEDIYNGLVTITQKTEETVTQQPTVESQPTVKSDVELKLDQSGNPLSGFDGEMYYQKGIPFTGELFGQQYVDGVAVKTNSPATAKKSELKPTIEVKPAEEPQISKPDFGSVDYLKNLIYPTKEGVMFLAEFEETGIDDKGRVISMTELRPTRTIELIDGVVQDSMRNMPVAKYTVKYLADNSVELTRVDIKTGTVTVTTYDKDGNEIKDNLTTPAGEVGSKEYFAKLLGLDFDNKNIKNIVYDNQGRMSSIELSYPVAKSKLGNQLSSEIYTINYDEWGSFNIVDDKKYAFYSNGNKNVESRINYDVTTSYYDNNGKLHNSHQVVEKDKYREYTDKDYDENGKGSYQYYSYDKFDDKGNVIESGNTTTFSDGSTLSRMSNYTYDANNNLVRDEGNEKANGEIVRTFVSEYKYDKEGRKIDHEYVVKDLDGNITESEKIKTAYYDNGNVKSFVNDRRWGEDFRSTNEEYYENGVIKHSYGKSGKDNGKVTYYDYEYSKDGTIKSNNNKIVDADGLVIKDEKSKYDEKGNLISTEAKQIIKAGEKEFINLNGINLRLNNPGSKNVEITYTIDGNGQMVLNASGLDISSVIKNLIYKTTNETVINDANPDYTVYNETTDDTNATNAITPKKLTLSAPLKNITINGNNNNIKGTAGDDMISVNGDNNTVDLGVGEDTLNITGNNNKIKNVENIDMNFGLTQPKIGTIEYIENLFGTKFSNIAENIKYADNGLISSFEINKDGTLFEYECFYDEVGTNIEVSHYDAGIKYSKNYVFEGTDLLSLTKVKSENGSWKDVEICDKEGNAITHVTNKNKDNEPHIAAYGNDGSITINFLNPNYKKSDSAFDEFIILDIKNGEKAVINKDGSVNVTKADGTIAKYDKDGSLISTVKYTYDENGKKAKAVRTEPNGTVTEFTYKNGVKSSAVKTNSAGTVTNYSYNSKGVVVSARAVTAKGIVYEYTYKNGIKSDAVRYVYDKNNNVISQRTYSYDKNGKNAAVKTQIRYKYNENGKLKSETKIFKGDAIENGVAKTVITYKSDGVTVDSIKKYDANGKKVD